MTVSSKWTMTIDLAPLKRPVRPPTSEDYSKWSLDQLKLEYTARKLNVIKNTKKNDRVAILEAWDTNKDVVEALLLRQRSQAKGESHEEAKRTKGWGSMFWTDVAAAFGADTGDFSTIISPESIFEGIDASFAMVHSAAKLKRMWKEVSSNFASAEAKSKVSGQGSNDFWDFCSGRADVYYLDRWCEHRQGGREFCAANLYAEDEDDSTREGQPTKQTVNRKRRKTSRSSEILERVSALLENEMTDVAAVQEGTWNEQRLFIQEQRTAQKLTTLYSMLDHNDAVTKQLLVKRQEHRRQGIDAADIGEALAAQQEKSKHWSSTSASLSASSCTESSSTSILKTPSVLGDDEGQSFGCES
ncbi:Hypothetical protein PHPALM_13256 [Phytophthora palmivora]|uniref:Uncharacterized protein n=1 Tax=Phytophthora palmivora TaxID=4796 RepID=A0A2P4XXN3_9STRA|nr:Hypothetical protein PHPALM_13256 [Phytophthora palmivora]